MSIKPEDADARIGERRGGDRSKVEKFPLCPQVPAAFLIVKLPSQTASKLRQVARERDMTVPRTAAVLLSDALERDRSLTKEPRK